MRRLRTSLARLSAVAMLASLLALVGGSPAQADPIPTTNWTPVTIGSDLPAAGTVMTDPSGGVTVGCQISSTYTTSFKSFSSTGSLVQDVAFGNPGGAFCTGNGAVGKDGTVYVGASAQSGYGQYIQAWKNNSLVWQYQIPCGSYGAPWTMTMGANGNVYTTIWQGGSPCNSGMQLIGLTPTAQAGSNPPVPQVVVNMSLGTSVRGGGAAAYDDGLVFFTHSNTVQYAPYSVTSTANLPDPVPISNAVSSYIGAGDRWFEAQPDGTVFLPIRSTTAQSLGCSNPNNRTGSILAVKSDGTTSTGSPFGGCTTIHEISPLPNGGAAFRYAYSPTAGVPEVEKVSAGSWSKDIGDPEVLNGVVMSADLNGNIALRFNLAPWHTVNGSTYRFPQISFRLLSGVTGEDIAQFALRGEHDTTNGPSYMWGNGGDLALAKNTVYVVARDCTHMNYCPDGTTKLYAFTVPGVQMDYPRGAILKHDEPWKEYVAMGDSFSSGEGVEPFLAGTNTGGSSPNVCHRSEGAYSKLLSGNPGTRLNLTNFVACSGAETAQIDGTWDPGGNKNLNEPAQVSVLNANTNVVTISIGGNDIGFAKFVTLCLFLDCSSSSMNQSFFDAVDGLGTALSGTYDDILTAAPNATVHVVGYPQLLPDPSSCSNPLGAGVAVFNSLVEDAKGGNDVAEATVRAIGQWAGVSSSLIEALIDAGQVTFTSSEITAGRNLTTALNSKISATVSAKSSARLKFVSATAGNSPFFGHELCTSTPYFNGLDVVNQSYSFHPNQLGQDAYRQLLLTQL